MQLHGFVFQYLFQRKENTSVTLFYSTSICITMLAAENSKSGKYFHFSKQDPGESWTGPLN